MQHKSYIREYKRILQGDIKMKYIFGVDIGGTTIKFGLFEETGALLDTWFIPTRTEDVGKNILPDLYESVLVKMEEKNLTKQDIVGIGVGVPAPVNAEGIVHNSANLGWNYIEVKRELEEMSGMRAEIGNDANVAALGEMWLGGGQGYKNLIMVTLGTGVGGGIITDGKILVGQNGAGGEIGHFRVSFDETESCGCGNKGCLEQYSSATGIVRIGKKRLAITTRDTVLTEDDLSAKAVFDAVKSGDEVALEIAEEFGFYLGSSLSKIASVIDPAVIVIGGGVSKAGETLLPFIKKPYDEYAFFANRDVEFKLATLGNDAGICGAAKLVLG